MVNRVKESDMVHPGERLNKAKELINDSFKREIVISNHLAREKSRYTLEEEKMAYYIFSHLNPHSENATNINLSKKRIISIFGGSSKSTYDLIKNRLKGMIMKSIITIKDDKKWKMGVLITDIEWNEQDDVVQVRLNDSFMPYIQNLTAYYTKLSWESIVAFQSKHALTLYKYLSSWAIDDEVVLMSFKTKELKELFGLEIDEYTYKGKFMRPLFENKVIDVAVDEINAKGLQMRVRYEKVKKGRFVLGYVFEFIRIKD